MKRDSFVTGAIACLTPVPAAAAQTAATALENLELRYGGRLGVAAFDTGSRRRIGHRAGERFAMCSTFKLPLVAAVLARVDAGRDRLGRFVRYGKSDVLEYAPVTRAHAGDGGMTLGALCAAAVEHSDNTAANLLLATIGGPAGFTRYVRGLGDPITRLDRTEPSLNTATQGDVRDTTTPAAMQNLVLGFVLGDALGAHSRTLLRSWLRATTTGTRRLRAGIPPSREAGDKTGTGNNAATNDVAIVWPPGRAPIVIAAYSAYSHAPLAQREDQLAGVARIAVRAFS